MRGLSGNCWYPHVRYGVRPIRDGRGRPPATGVVLVLWTSPGVILSKPSVSQRDHSWYSLGLAQKPRKFKLITTVISLE